MSFEIPEHVRPIRERVLRFVEDHVYPAEAQIEDGHAEEARSAMRRLMQQAKDAGLWALGHPKEIGGQGMPFLDYAYVNEVVGRSTLAMVALGTHSLQDSIMLNEFASDEWRQKYLKPLVAGEIFPSFAMTEPAVASSDPTQLETTARLDGDQWVIARSGAARLRSDVRPRQHPRRLRQAARSAPADPEVHLRQPVRDPGEPPDGPDEVHVMTTARRILKHYETGEGWDFGLR